MTTKTPKDRVAALRKRRKEAGLTRLEVWAHPGDHREIKALAGLLRKMRHVSHTDFGERKTMLQPTMNLSRD